MLAEQVEKRIHIARGEKVLLDADLGTLHGVETKSRNRSVKRSRSRLPPDFQVKGGRVPYGARRKRH